MRAGADLFGLVPRAHVEFDPPTIDAHHLGLAEDTRADGGRCEMTYVDPSADRAHPGLEVGFACVECRVLHDHDHHRRRQDGRQHRVLELIGQVLGLDHQLKLTFGADGYLFHATSSSLSRCGYSGESLPRRTSRAGNNDPNRLWSATLAGS